MKHQLAPRPEPYPEAVSNLLSSYPHRDGYLLALFRVFANSERFLRKGTLNLLDRESPLTMREREIVILRVCAKLGCEYEWGVHVTAFSAYVGLTSDQVESTAVNGVGDCWTGSEKLLVQVVDDLCDKGTVSDEHLADFQEKWTLEQQLEILALCGNYHTISFVANTARLQGEAFGRQFPSS